MKFISAASGLAIALIFALQAPVAAGSARHARLTVSWTSRETWTGPDSKGTTLVRSSYSTTVVFDATGSFGKVLGPSRESAFVSMTGSGDPTPDWHWNEVYATSIVDTTGRETQHGTATAGVSLLDDFSPSGQGLGFRLQVIAAHLKGQCTATHNLPCGDMAMTVQSDGKTPPTVTQSIDVTSAPPPSGAGTPTYLTPFSGATSSGSPRTGYHFNINGTKEWNIGQIHYKWQVQADATITLV